MHARTQTHKELGVQVSVCDKQSGQYFQLGNLQKHKRETVQDAEFLVSMYVYIETWQAGL